MTPRGPERSEGAKRVALGVGPQRIAKKMTRERSEGAEARKKKSAKPATEERR